jgi:hypothetical protein
VIENWTRWRTFRNKKMKQEGGNNGIKERIKLFSIAKDSRNDRIKEGERSAG